MNDDMLSQDEINALLSGMDNDDNSDNEEENTEENVSDNNLKVENYLSSIEQDALGEIGNISFGSSATALSTLLNQKVDITTPKVSVISKKEIEKEFPKPHVAISVEYTVGFEGVNLLVIKQSDASIIADLMMGNDGLNAPDDLGDMEISAVQEAMNQMMGSASTSMSTIFNKKVDISPPGIDLLDFSNNQSNVELPDDDVLVNISFNLKVGDLIDSKIMQLVTISFAKDMVDQLMNPTQDDTPSNDVIQHAQEELPPQPQSQQEDNTVPASQPSSRESSDTNLGGQQYANRTEPQHVTSGYSAPGRSVNVQPAAFSNFDTPSLNENEAKNLDMLLDIPLSVTVELGRTKRSIKDILELSPGSVVELDKLAGEPVDILVNQRLIAKGEVVVIDENFGVRVTDIVSQKDRLNKLK
ncbi:flagellar motor switch phosphatase FliY [Salipaludibacillus neizhouensis]|uniref:Flagellar motor switch phosphatase FliY n=1 Tax=Salipaludibacillus neizhouensis TaxID=885475 RepID=A0A3A9K7P1_9BACI|nr:flagellar motor switch phosphatase FliY [Salipaludibacillus neizhouensis]RKL69004.1 flagellar motor switch phosphatase FliY [Salipaludibacillus neizhouensis]